MKAKQEKEGSRCQKEGPASLIKHSTSAHTPFFFFHRWRNLLSVRAHHTFYVHINIERVVK